jgi:hypothetical protein
MTSEELASVSNFRNRMLLIRDRLDPIVKGEITRGRSLAGQRGMPGKRKTTCKDAARIAHHIQAAINLAIDDLDKHLD